MIFNILHLAVRLAGQRQLKVAILSACLCLLPTTAFCTSSFLSYAGDLANPEDVFTTTFTLTGTANISYKDAVDNVSFVDGHASYIKLYYNATLGPAPFAYPTPQIPGSYNYQKGPD